MRRPNGSHVLASPAAMAARFADHPQAVAESAELAEQLDFDLTGDLGYRYPGVEDEDGAAPSGRALRRAPERALRGRRAARGRARLEQELAVIETLSLAGFFLLHHEILELSREVAAEVRGPGLGARAAAAGARARLLRLLDRLLPDRPLAHRPARRRPLDGALPQPRADLAAGHRPRLPARHARGPDPPRPRALRARPRGARRDLPELSRARRDPRARQGARAARGRDRARRPRRRPLRASRGARPRERAGGARRRAAAGPGWRGSPRRRSGCRATSPSTRAG